MRNVPSHNIRTFGLYWIYAKRPVHKPETCADRQRAVQQLVRGPIWWFCAGLKAYRREPMSRRRGELRTHLDRGFQRTPGFVTLDGGGGPNSETAISGKSAY